MEDLENITASNVNCEEHIEMDINTGKINLSDTSCENLKVNGDTGDIFLKDVISSGKFYIECDTGDVTLEKCDASEIFIKTDTGDVKGSLRSSKVFITETDTGSINVPKTVTGGRCEITTDTGDIGITVLTSDNQD